MEDLTYEKQKEFIMKHKLPYEQIPLVSFHSEASIAPWSAEPQAVSGFCRSSFFDCKLISEIFITFCFDDELVKFRFEELIGDVYTENEISEMPLAAYNDTVWSASFLFDSLGFYSSMDDIFTRLLTLASYISRRFIQFIEDLVVRDADRYSDDLLVISAGQHVRSLRHGICKSFSEDVPFIFKGLTLPLHGLQFAWRLAISCWRSSVVYVRCAHLRICSLASRVQKTLQGSSDDMVAAHSWHAWCGGWYSKILGVACRNKHTLPSSFVYLLIPGLYSNHGPVYFVGTKKFFSKMGLACHIAKIYSEASVEHNAWELKQYIEELYWGSGKRVMLLGHSKGGIDAAAALSIYWCDLKDKVAGLALIADKEARRIMELLIRKLIKAIAPISELGDIRPLEDLTYEKRKEFIMKHKLPYEQIPLVSFHSEAKHCSL
ncbi:unnamed protein product [Prunus brigantina]